MNLSKSATMGNSKTFYDPINGLLFGQWKDNKVVSFISTLMFIGNGTTMQWSGRNKISLACPEALQAYNKCMGYVDLVNFDKKIGGTFTGKCSFKKLYKKGYLGITDFMLVNGCVAWNMSEKLRGVFGTTRDKSKMKNICS